MRFEFRKAWDHPKAWEHPRFTIVTRSYDLEKARKIKGHYRKLPNGRIVWIKEHFDKRSGAQKKYPTARVKGYKGDLDMKNRHKVIHADDEATTYVNWKGEHETFKHEPYNELTQDDIHATLNSALTVDDELALKMWKHKMGIKDMDQFLGDLIEDEKQRAKDEGDEPEFTNKKDAMAFLMSAKSKKGRGGMSGVKEYLKELQGKYGHVTTHTNAYNHMAHDDYRKYIDSLNEEGADRDDEAATAKMIAEHADSAQEAAEAEAEDVEKAKKMKPQDCPELDGLSEKTKLFGHQAETIARLGILKKAIVDVDMGGGKGLILPADAMNLMAQGKVKRPLVVVPGFTLEQNASKIHEYTDGGMNVFLIDNGTIKNRYGGSVEAMVADIQKAPPNTIFMATYNVFSYKDPDAEEGDEYARGRVLGGAGFDYVALDEAHNIKNIQTARFKSMKFLTKAKYKRVASGTFISNNPSDALGQLLFLHPQMAMKQEQFEKKYGRVEDETGVHWTGLKQLRADLEDLGMISLRRSAWIDKLPERNEELSVVKMEKAHAAIHEAVLTDVIEQLQEEASKNPRLKKWFDDDGLGEADDLPPQALAKLGLVGAVVDHPHEMAEMMDAKIEAVKDAQKRGDLSDDEAEEVEAMLESLMKLKSETRRAIRSLRGMVSPKAKDVYKQIDAHFKNKKNGKYIVFVQRKASASHIMDNMPEHLKKMAVYYDASKKSALDAFIKDPKGPQIIVAVDASVKEGVNMQVANGMYRYDHHWSPGNQEQSYARIWRFGQDKPTKFHIGVVDGSIDVPKYARLMTKLGQNMAVISDFQDTTASAFKMNLSTLQEKNDASILPEYLQVGKDIIDFQKEENKSLQKRYGKGMIERATGKPIGGKEAKKLHGIGAYHSDVTFEKVEPLSDEQSDSLLGHFRDAAREMGGEDAPFDPEIYDAYFLDAYNLMARHNAKGGGEKFDPNTLEAYAAEHDEANPDDPMSPNEKKFLSSIMERTVGGKKHTPHEKSKLDHPVNFMLKQVGFGTRDKSAVKTAMDEVSQLVKLLGKDSLTHLGEGKVENPEVAEKAIKALEKKAGEKFSPKYRRFLIGAAAMHQEMIGGWGAVKYQYEDHIRDLSSEQQDDEEEK